MKSPLKPKSLLNGLFTCGRQALSYGFFGFRVKNMELVHVEDDLNFVADALLRARIHAGDKRILSIDKIEEGFVAHQLGHVHFCGDSAEAT